MRHRLAAEIVRVQDNADQLAQRWADAQLRSEDLAVELVTAQTKLAVTTAQYNRIAAGLTEIAINRFTGSSRVTMLVVFANPTDELQMNVLRSVAVDQGAADLDAVDSVRADLDKDRERVDALRAENDQIAQQLTSRQAEIEQQLVELTTLREHLKDEEVKLAYERQRAKKRRELAEQQASAAAAATTAAPTAQARGGGNPAKRSVVDNSVDSAVADPDAFEVGAGPDTRTRSYTDTRTRAGRLRTPANTRTRADAGISRGLGE